MPTSSPFGGTLNGGAAGAGTGGYGNLNSVDIALIVAFSILGAALLAAVVWFIVKFSRKAVADSKHAVKSEPNAGLPPVVLQYSADGDV
jgi:hypothetical protein